MSLCVCVCDHEYLSKCSPLCEEPEKWQMVFGHVHWVFTVYFKQLLCSLAHAAALKHSFLCDTTWGYTRAIHPSAAIFILESVYAELYGVTWVVSSGFPAWARWGIIWSPLSSWLSEVEVSTYSFMIKCSLIDLVVVNLWNCGHA